MELFEHETVEPAAILAATAAGIYKVFMDFPPPPKVETKFPELPWPVVWSRLWRPKVAAEEADVAFKMLHNILTLRGRLARFGVQQGAHCLACPGVLEDVQHFFITCPRVAAVWDQLVASLLIHTGPVPDLELLYLSWPFTADLSIYLFL